MKNQQVGNFLVEITDILDFWKYEGLITLDMELGAAKIKFAIRRKEEWKKEHRKEMEAGKEQEQTKEEEGANRQIVKEEVGSEMSKVRERNDNLYGYTTMPNLRLGNNIWTEIW